MKKIFLASFVLLSFVYHAQSFSQIIAEKGNGHVVTLKRSVSKFEKIKCEGKVEMRFYVNDEYHAVVTIDSNLDKYIEVSTKDDMLSIKNKNNGMYAEEAFTQCLVEIYCPVIKSVSIFGSGSFGCADKIITSTFVADISGSGRIDGIFECDNFSAKISGSGGITVAGVSRDTNISITGSGKFSGIVFETKNAVIKIGGSGKASICVADNLNVTLSGEGYGGEIIYRGEPTIESNISGSGKIIKM